MNALFSGILPGGETRSHRAKRALVYLLGCSVGGTLLGLGLGVVGGFTVAGPSTYLATALGVIGFLFAMHEFGLIRVPFPDPKRTVPNDWGRTGSRGVVIWGFTTGLGLLTTVAFPGHYVFLLLVVIVGDPLYGAATGLAYGLSRSLPLLPWSVPRDVSNITYHGAVSTVFSWSRRVHVINGVALTVLSVVAFAGW